MFSPPRGEGDHLPFSLWQVAEKLELAPPSVTVEPPKDLGSVGATERANGEVEVHDAPRAQALCV